MNQYQLITTKQLVYFALGCTFSSMLALFIFIYIFSSIEGAFRKRAERIKQEERRKEQLVREVMES